MLESLQTSTMVTGYGLLASPVTTSSSGIKFEKDKEGNISIDRTGRANGRGAYLCDNIGCLEKAVKSKKLEREFETKTYDINGKSYDVTFKIGYVNGEVISRRPEYEDLKHIAQDTGLALRKVKELIR